MTVITAEQLSDTVGAEVVGVDREQLLGDEALPAWTLDALEANGALVFRGLHIDDATQVAFSKKLGRVEMFGSGEHPEIFRVTLDPTKNPAGRLPAGDVRLAHRRLHRRRPHQGHAAERARGRRVRRGDRVRQHVRGLRRSDRRGTGPPGLAPGRPHHRGVPAPGQRRPLARGAGRVAIPAIEGAPAGVDPPVGPPLAGPRGHDVPRGRHGPRRGPGAPGRSAGPLDHPRPGVPARVVGRGHGHLGQPGRPAPRLPVRPRRRPATCTARP